MCAEEQAEETEKTTEPIIKNQWMIRPCTVYEDEYSDCTSLKARFNQYFIHGKSTDCSQWKRDADACYRWGANQDLKSANELVASEQARRKERLEAHYNNTVWEKRRSPPEDWNKPLPPELLQEYENTYLNIKAKELRGELKPSFDSENSFCVIS